MSTPAGEDHGLLISGAGGLGKTRLSLELAWRAHASGWAVLRAGERFRANALVDLACGLTPRDRVLVLFDYVETQPAFPEVAAELSELNETYGLHLRYVANCRTSYVSTYQVLHAYYHVDLSPPPGDAGREWLRRYRTAAVRRILASRGLVGTQAYLDACDDVPVLAVFLCWLADNGRSTEFEALLEEPDFGAWVLASAGKSFAKREVGRELAMLMGMMPAPVAALETASAERFVVLLNRLATDAWVERVRADLPGGDDRWAVIHDVLADQVLLAYLRTIPLTVPEFVRELLRTAATLGVLEPSFAALQRIGHRPLFEDVQWAEMFRGEMDRAPEAWRAVRSMLLRSSLLSEVQRVRLLAAAPEVWVGAERDPTYCIMVGWFCKWATKINPGGLGAVERAGLANAAQIAGDAADRSNFVLTHGLRLTPTLRQAALHWMWLHPEEFQTHYLLVAWLEEGLGIEEVRHVVIAWANRFPTSAKLSFVVRAWLEASGEIELVTKPIQQWLREHATSESAQFVCSAWLRRGGEIGLVAEAIQQWLSEHATSEGAQFVFWAWLDAGGEIRLVGEAIERWLGEHATSERAGFVSSAWLKAGGETGRVAEAIQRWLGEHATSERAGFVYAAWLDAGGEVGLVEEAVQQWLRVHATSESAHSVYRAWLEAGGELGLVGEDKERWLSEHATGESAGFVYRAWLDAGGEIGLVRERIQQWAREHATRESAGSVYRAWLDAGGEVGLVEEAIQQWSREHATSESAHFVYRAWLDVGGELDVVAEALQLWLREHATNLSAHFVYRAWLGAGGELGPVAEAIRQWLEEHATNVSARLVYRSWIEAGGKFSIIRGPALEWLKLHRNRSDASHFLSHAVHQFDLPLDTIRDVLYWCLAFPKYKDRIWIFLPTGVYFRIPELGKEAVAACEEVLPTSLFPLTRVPPRLRELTAGMFRQLIANPNLQHGLLRARTDTLFSTWIRHPASFSGDLRAFSFVQREWYFQRVCEMVRDGLLSPVADGAALCRYMQWVNRWSPGAKQKLAPFIEDLNRCHPAPGIWDQVTFDSDQAVRTSGWRQGESTTSMCSSDPRSLDRSPPPP